MEITIIGWIVIPLTVLLFLLAPSWLYVLMVFFIPFSATAVINFNSLGSGLPVTIFIGSFWILNCVFRTIKTFHFRLPLYRGMSLALLVIFLLAVLMSLVMPIVIDGKMSIASETLYSEESTPLVLEPRHIVQALYLIYGVMIAILVATKNSHFSELLRSLKIYVISAIFVSAWGWLQWLLYHLGMPYPDYLFNNSITPTAAGYLAETESSQTIKMCSVAVEASIFAEYLLTVIPVILFAQLSKETIIGHYIDRFALAITISALFITESTVGYVGAIVLILITLMMLYVLHELRMRHLLSVIVTVCAIIFSYAYLPSVKAAIDGSIFQKIESYSALERLYTIVNAWGYFLEHPFLGIGWGSFTSHDLIVKLLASTGVIGFASFTTLIVYMLIRIKNSLVRATLVSDDYKAIKFMVAALGCSFLTLLFSYTFAGLFFVFSHLWFIFGMVVAVISIANKKYFSQLIVPR